MQADICRQLGKRYFNRRSLLRYIQSSKFSREKSTWNSKQVRRLFLDFFCKESGHSFVKSSSVIPPKDMGTYFTNAGMNQFKPIFLGTVPHGSEMLDFQRVANSQKCVRVGGKHNDLDDVGADLTHHTFFEMLGSWSFGDYFKDEACRLALTLLVEGYKLPMDRLYFTYFGGDAQLGLEADLHCREIWLRLGVPPAHILPFGAQDNFWDMGDTGPCGPCTEIHYDHQGNKDAAHLVNTGSPQVVEIWNLVFMQYDRLAADRLVPLPSTHVDTGMGLERMCAVMQGTRSNYNTDLFHPIFDVIHQEAGIPTYRDATGCDEAGRLDRAYRIIADHTRMATVCISDGLLPGRLDLEHKLRSVIHRSLYQCHDVLKVPRGMMAQLVAPIVESLGDVYPEISSNSEKVKDVLLQTEENYIELHERGEKNFRKLIKKYPRLITLTGEHLQHLHEGHYGSPMSLEMIELIAPSYKLTINQSHIDDIIKQEKSFQVHMEVLEFPCLTSEIVQSLVSGQVPPTDDHYKYQFHLEESGYVFPSLQSTVACLLDEGNQVVQTVCAGSRVGIIVDKTQFYSEKGGQVGDTGIFRTDTGSVVITDTQSNQDYVLHIGTVSSGYIETNQMVTLEIDRERREGCMKHHTATHLLNSALRTVVGDDVTQRASSVQPHKLTFDFSCRTPINNKDLARLEQLVNSTIEQNLVVGRQLQPLKEAKSIDGVVFLNDVLYPSEVFVVTVDKNDEDAVRSIEFCGGTHVHQTSDLGYFCITNLSGVSSGTKSVTALTGQAAKQTQDVAYQLLDLCGQLEVEMKGSQPDLDRVIHLQKYINQGLGTEVLPKVAKDDIMQRMDHLGSDISAVLNKQAFIQLQQDLNNKMEGDAEFIVHHFTMKTLLKLNKLMSRQQVTKPMILVVDTSNNTVAYILLPQEYKAVLTNLVQDFCTCVDGRVTKRESNFQLASRKGSHVELFLTTAYTILEKHLHNTSDLSKLR